MSRSRASTGPAAASSRSSPAAEDKLAESRAEHEATLHVARDEPVVFQGYGEPMRGGPGKSGGCHEAREGRRARLQGGEHQSGFIKYADSARVIAVHTSILPSQMVICKFQEQRMSRKEARTPRTLAEKVG